MGVVRSSPSQLGEKTKGAVNPRYQLGHWLLASGYGLTLEGADGRLSLTAAGRDVINNPGGQTTRDLDEGEGVLEILRLVAEGGPLSSGELKGEWRGYLGRVSRIRSESYARSALLARLNNLRDRHLVERTGHRYVATEAGLAWLKGAGQVHAADIEPEEADLFKIINDQRAQVKNELLSLLSEMDPIGFEHVIAQLLEAMGYTDVEVTSPSGDKGVDVVGTIKLGISTVREVVQVKRVKANLRRPVLDQLRGSLHRFRAVRGTIITTGGFSKGTQEAAFEIGAAPITLINGETLVELLMEKEIGARKRPVVLWEVDASAFEEG